MVAVFTKTYARFKELRLNPKTHISITRVNDIRGKIFTSINIEGDAFKSITTRDAFSALQKSQPNLFKNV